MKISGEIRRYSEENGCVLHQRPWRKKHDGCEWFFGDLDLRRGGDALAYRVFEFSEEKARLFDEACEGMLKDGKLRYLGPAMGDQGAIYDFRTGVRV